jgi:hypothetical protein
VRLAQWGAAVAEPGITAVVPVLIMALTVVLARPGAREPVSGRECQTPSLA